MYNLHNRRFNNFFSTYNRREQNRAISSAETQVSIANAIMKSTTSGLTIRASALVTAANNYVSQMNEITSKIPSSSSSNYLSEADNSQISESTADNPVNKADYHIGETSLSKASNSSASVGKVLVSLKSNVGVIYSLVNDQNSSNQD